MNILFLSVVGAWVWVTNLTQTNPVLSRTWRKLINQIEATALLSEVLLSFERTGQLSASEPKSSTTLFEVATAFFAWPPRPTSARSDRAVEDTPGSIEGSLLGFVHMPVTVWVLSRK